VNVSDGTKELAPRRRAPPPEVTPVAVPEAPPPETEGEPEEPRTATGLEPLIDLLNEGDERERAGAAKELGKLGAAAAPAAETLVQLLQDVSADVQAAAADALGSIGAKAVPYLVAALAVDDADSIAGAARALARMGPAGRDALPALEKRKDHTNARVREAVREACAKVSG
jgi:HEAT repeat protein